MCCSCSVAVPSRRVGIAHYRDGRDSRFADAGGIAERVAFCRYNCIRDVCSNDWTGEVPAGRVKGRTIKWVSKSRGREQLSIEWKLGIRDDGYVPGQVTYTRNIGLVHGLYFEGQVPE